MNYWHMNLHPTNVRGTDDDIRKLVLSHTIGMGFFDSPQVGYFKNKVQIGDVVAILNGRTLIALVEIIGDWYEFSCDEESIIWFPLRRSVKILCIRGGEGGECFSNISLIPKTRTSTLEISKNKNCATYKYINNLYECYKNN